MENISASRELKLKLQFMLPTNHTDYIMHQARLKLDFMLYGVELDQTFKC